MGCEDVCGEAHLGYAAIADVDSTLEASASALSRSVNGCVVKQATRYTVSKAMSSRKLMLGPMAVTTVSDNQLFSLWIFLEEQST